MRELPDLSTLFHAVGHDGPHHGQRLARAPRRVFDRERAATQVLEDAVARVRRNCRIALDTRGALRSRLTAMDLLGPINDDTLLAAATSAQMLLDAEA